MHKSFFTDHKDIALISACLSLLISAWCVYLDPVINNDGIQYIKAAQRIADGQFSELITIYKWPFYPFLIALIQLLLPVNIEVAAHLLNAGLTIILVIAFLSLVYELGGNRKTITVAAFIILLFPSVNELRSEIIRDIGYVGFYLYSITFLLRYFRNKERRNLFGWLVCMTFAIFFRIEGAILLFVLPIVSLLLMEKGQTRSILLSFFSLFALVALIILFLLWSSTALYQPDASLSDGFFLHLADAANQMLTDLDKRILSLQRNFLGKFSEQYAYTIYVFALILILQINLMKTEI